MKKVSPCADKGYVQMQQKLVRGEALSCKICTELLESCQYSQANFEKFLEAEASVLDEDEDGPDTSMYGPWDGLAYAQARGDHYVILNPGDFGKKLPVRCTICKSKKFPAGKLLDLTTRRLSTVRHFLIQHEKSHSHKEGLRVLQIPQDFVEPPCQAIQISDRQRSGPLFEYQKEFHTWCLFACLDSLAKHKYWKDSENGWCIRSRNCLEKVKDPCPRGQPACVECKKLVAPHSVVRSVQRFTLKYLTAKLLHARLFLPEDAREEVLDEVKASPLFRKDTKKLNTFLNMKNADLQQFVRLSWRSTGEKQESNAMKDFMTMVVMPSLRCNTANASEVFADVVARFTAFAASGNASENDVANIKIATAAISGSLDEHPLLQGLALQCKRMLDKRARGITTMVGRRSVESDFEAQLIADAGMRFCMASGNTKLGQEWLIYEVQHHVL